MSEQGPRGAGLRRERVDRRVALGDATGTGSTSRMAGGGSSRGKSLDG